MAFMAVSNGSIASINWSIGLCIIIASMASSMASYIVSMAVSIQQVVIQQVVNRATRVLQEILDVCALQELPVMVTNIADIFKRKEAS